MHATRVEVGRKLALEAPADADLVIPVPESGTPAAVGYSQGSGIPYGLGLVKNSYVGRTFIQPSQTIRQLGIRLKLNPLREVIAGKRLVVVDDSIVRGNTQRALVRMLREAGAAEVHVRISSPPVKWPCFYGIDFASPAELVANGLTVEEIRASIDADSLAYISLEGLVEATEQPIDNLCRACFDGVYPVALPEPELLGKHLLELEPVVRPPSAGHALPASAPLPRRRCRRRRRPHPPMTDAATGASYAAAGVDIEAGDRAVELMKAWVAKATRPEVVGGIGGFAGLFDASLLTSYRRPLLATSTDGVGTKVAVAAAADRHDTIGHDLVGMVVDDLVVCGAEPLFMTDYIACGKVVPERVAAIVKGIAEGCVLAGCALIGGETAEHPGLLGPDEYDVAGAGTGVVEADRLLGADRVRDGDVLVAMAASGLHSNGYSLVRHVLLDPGRLGAGPRGRRAGPAAGRRAARADPDLRARLPGADRPRDRRRGARVQPRHRRRAGREPGPGAAGAPVGHRRPVDLDAAAGVRAGRRGGRGGAGRARAHPEHGRRDGGRGGVRRPPTARSSCSPTAACPPGCSAP